MPPYKESEAESAAIEQPLQEEAQLISSDESKAEAPLIIVWRNVIYYLYLHVAALYGVYLLLTEAKWQTWVCTYVLYILSLLGVTAGVHRLWSHRAYKARLPLRIFLALVNSLAFQNHIYEWARDHRIHHKSSETHADPHNARRGFFFAHMGWLLCRKHPDVIKKGATIDMSDILKDPVVRFQKKFYIPSVLIMCFIFPMTVPYYFWGETLWNSFWICSIFRYCIQLHATWFINSAAHLWGDKPYDKHINPAENTFVTTVIIGEGFHNYHHTFPWDYSASEWGWNINLTTFFINLWAFLGLAYDLKKVPQDIVDKRRYTKGDGSYPWYTTSKIVQ